MKKLIIMPVLLAVTQLFAQGALTSAHKTIGNTQVSVVPIAGMNPTKDGFTTSTMRLQVTDMRAPFTQLVTEFTAENFELKKQKLGRTERFRFNNAEAIWVETTGLGDVSLKYTLCVGNGEQSKLLTVNMVGTPDEAVRTAAEKLLKSAIINFGVENEAKFGLASIGSPYILTKTSTTALTYTMPANEKATITVKKLAKGIEGADLKKEAAAQLKEIGGKSKQADIEMRKYNNMVGCEVSIDQKDDIKIYQALINTTEGATFVLQAKGTAAEIKEAQILIDTFFVK